MRYNTYTYARTTATCKRREHRLTRKNRVRRFAQWTVKCGNRPRLRRQATINVYIISARIALRRPTPEINLLRHPRPAYRVTNFRIISDADLSCKRTRLSRPSPPRLLYSPWAARLCFTLPLRIQQPPRFIRMTTDLSTLVKRRPVSIQERPSLYIFTLLFWRNTPISVYDDLRSFLPYL